MEKNICAIMPGLVARVVVNEGDNVSEGQEVAVINCMKTEIPIKSEDSGIIKEILVKEWDEMQAGDAMIVIEV